MFQSFFLLLVHLQLPPFPGAVHVLPVPVLRRKPDVSKTKIAVAGRSFL